MQFSVQHLISVRPEMKQSIVNKAVERLELRMFASTDSTLNSCLTETFLFSLNFRLTGLSFW